MERVNKLYNASEAQKGLIQGSKDTSKELAVSIQGSFSYGVSPIKDKDEKDEMIAKLKEEDKKKQEELDKQRSSCAKFLDKIRIQKEKKYDIPLKPRSLDQIISLKDVDLKIKKGELVIIIGKIQSGKSSLMKTMVGELMSIPKKEIDFIGDRSRKLSEQE